MRTTVEAVHLELSEKAADLANQWAIEAGLVEAGHAPFHGAKRRGISLGLNDAIIAGRDDAWHDAIHRLALDAAHTTCEVHADLILGLVLGLARQGRNYFKEYGVYNAPQRYVSNKTSTDPHYHGPVDPLF